MLILICCGLVDVITIGPFHCKGFFCIRFPESMLESDVKQLYNNWLTKDFGSMKKIEVHMVPVVSLVRGPLPPYLYVRKRPAPCVISRAS